MTISPVYNEDATSAGTGAPEGIENEIATLIEACWHQTPSERPTFARVIDILQMKIDQVSVSSL